VYLYLIVEGERIIRRAALRSGHSAAARVEARRESKPYMKSGRVCLLGKENAVGGLDLFEGWGTNSMTTRI
jgi:hypothetical protein